MPSGKALVLVGGVVAAGVLFLVTTKKANAKPKDGSAPLPKEALPTNATTFPPIIVPPLQGLPTFPTNPGGVVVVPDGSTDDDDDDDLQPPLVVSPAPGPLPPVLPVPLPPPPPTATTIPGLPMTLPEIIQSGGDILEQAGIPVVVPLPEQITPPPPPPPPLVPPVILTEEAESPTALHDDTAAVLDVMLDIEATSKWKRAEPLLKAWQASRNLVADGKFGPKSAKTMASETGLLPIVRYWPTSSIKEKAVPAYSAELVALANAAEEPRRSQLMAAAQREKGQGFGTGQKAINPLISFDAPG
jgi:hypothetical protein